jgi:hypothetical protein
MAAQLGLVAPAASRRRPVSRPQAHESGYGFIARIMHEKSEREEQRRALRHRQYGADLREQAREEGKKRELRRENASIERRLEEELRKREGERLRAIRDEKISQLRAEGVKEARVALLAKMSVH